MLIRGRQWNSTAVIVIAAIVGVLGLLTGLSATQGALGTFMSNRGIGFAMAWLAVIGLACAIKVPAKARIGFIITMVVTSLLAAAATQETRVGPTGYEAVQRLVEEQQANELLMSQMAGLMQWHERVCPTKDVLPADLVIGNPRKRM